ncbi:uncharacterized protein BO95DRAFT_241987 [Aspergillus brunneoviolaceus CBS 621.78]|uniref:Uncharacterized protein n=1 Tax=Aspergillus brunneoviolaceus CBS 621.78 TaxID=1450534 RepID=A0ACD1FYQ0_9EURO|nr:hypothetical protein BO95DRAFT_241987 [Aspergillus brunneoviolaceus CBS 621.78]RAH42110.1 hypothetical protein BO95DRAFT_241987 [Aspergillus brunneoviolaceus CBS 621.78]
MEKSLLRDSARVTGDCIKPSTCLHRSFAGSRVGYSYSVELIAISGSGHSMRAPDYSYPLSMGDGFEVRSRGWGFMLSNLALGPTSTGNTMHHILELTNNPSIYNKHRISGAWEGILLSGITPPGAIPQASAQILSPVVC